MIRTRASSLFSGEKGGGAGGGGNNKTAGLQCRVLMLDGRDLQLEINKKTSGQWLFDYIVKMLKIVQQDFYGILYEDEQKCQQWLDLTKPVRKQAKKNTIQLFFSIRYYPIDPTAEDAITRSQVYWQVKRDFVDGRLPCTSVIGAQLCGYIAQAELCDWLEPRTEYLMTLGLLNPEFQKMEDDIMDHHKKFKGMTPIEAMTAFLDIASRLDFYGMLFFEVKYEEKLPYILGLSPHGIALCKEFVVMQSFAWNRFVQVSYKGKKFTVKVTGNWAANSKNQNIHFEVDSTRTCKEIYETLIEYINFYKDSVPGKAHPKGPTQIKLPSSVSTDVLSQALLQSITNEEERREKERTTHGLQRSLSLPRNSKLRVQSPSHPLASSVCHPNVTAGESNHSSRAVDNYPLQRRRLSDPLVDDAASSSSGNSRELRLSSDPHLCGDTRSVGSHDSMRDSLLDLADDLGEEEEVCPSHHRSNSNPEIAVNSVALSMSRSYDGLSGHLANSPADGAPVDQSQKKKNRLLVQNWVKEQRKKEQIEPSISPPNFHNVPTIQTNSRSSSTSPTLPYKLKVHETSTIASTSSSPVPRPNYLPYYRPNSAAAATSYQIEDIYSIPRPSPAPSPCFFRKPHPFSNCHGSQGNLLVPSRSSTSHNNYDIPRSLMDLRRVNSSGPAAGTGDGLTVTEISRGSHHNIMTAHSENSLTGKTSSSSTRPSASHQESLSSLPVLDQMSFLKEEYPDYDIPKPHVRDYPDYDIPKPHSTKVSVTSEPDFGGQEVGLTEPSFPNLSSSFGVLDSIIAEIDDHVAAAQKSNSIAYLGSVSLPSLADSNNDQVNTSCHVKENSTPAVLAKKEPIYDHLAAKVALQQLIVDGIVQPDLVRETKEEQDAVKMTEKKEEIAEDVQLPSDEEAVHPVEKVLLEETVIPVEEVTDVLPEETVLPVEEVTETKVPLAEMETVPTVLPVEEVTETKVPLAEMETVPTVLPVEETLVPPGHLADLTRNFKFDRNPVNSHLANLPFDPDFFARQTALERGKQLPPDVAKFMSWVKTRNITPAAPSAVTTAPNDKPLPSSTATPSNDNAGSLPIEQSHQMKTPPTHHEKTQPISHLPPTTHQNKTPPTGPSPPRPKEPLYHEINQLETPVKNPTDSLLNGHSVRDTRGSESPPTNNRIHGVKETASHESVNSVTDLPSDGEVKPAKILPAMEKEKENRKFASFRKDKSLPFIQRPDLTVSSAREEADSVKRWRSFNTRRPLQIKLEVPSSHPLGDESIPNSPSFYTANPMAATMPPASTSEQDQTKQGFRDHLTRLGTSNTAQQRHRVVNWVKGTQQLLENTENRAEKTLPLPIKPKPHPQNRPLMVSQSVQSRLGQLPPVKTSKTSQPGSPNQFKDHLYEDPDVLLKSTLLERKATEPVFSHSVLAQTQFYTAGRPRSQSQAVATTGHRASRPYVTREHKSSSGTTVYATDV